MTGQHPRDLAKDILRVVEGNDYATIQYSLRIAGIIAEYESDARFRRENPTLILGQSDSSES